MKGVQVVVECTTCGNAIEGKVIAIQGTLFDDHDDIVGGLLNDAGNDLICPHCKARLAGKKTRVLMVTPLAQVA
ncbi:MAG: hypothetical protein M1377_03900 [Deltaproteobacteria bacterium]|nr:hypothetical protein [Deltaproteobacteria bacterium]